MRLFQAPDHGSFTFYSNSSASFFFFFLAALEVCRTLVPQLGIEHGALTMKVQSPDRWGVCLCVCVCAHSVMSDCLGPVDSSPQTGHTNLAVSQRDGAGPLAGPWPGWCPLTSPPHLLAVDFLDQLF